MAQLFRKLIIAAAILFASPLPGAKHDIWFEARSPNFIVVSNAGEKQARKTAVEFEEIRAVYRQSIPLVGSHPSPVITILAVKDEDSLRALLPEYWVKGHAHPSGIFYFAMNQYYAAVQLDAPGDNPYRNIYHEYYHSVTLPYFPNLPLWVSEGLADFYGNTEIGDKDVGTGRPDADLIAALREGQFIPLATLFKVDHTSPYYNEQNKTSVFYAESWAIVHYLMVGDRASHKQQFVDYLTAIAHGATQDEAAAKAFGNLKQFQNTLVQYIGNRSFYFMKSPAPPKVRDADVKVQELSDAEADAYRGGFQAARGRTQDAKVLLQEAVRLDPKLALAYQNLGLAQFIDGQHSEALASVSQAISLDPKNGLTRFLRAYLSLRSTDELKDPHTEDDLREAISADPEFAEAYGLLATYLANQEESLPEALSIAKKAISLEPGNPSYQLSLAQVLVRMGRFDEAQTTALTARAMARRPEDISQTESFTAGLQRARAVQGQIEGGTADTPRSAEAAEAGPGDETPLEEVTGVVKEASCAGGGPKLEIQAESGVFQLHSPAMGGVQIMMASKPPAGFNLCKGLTGANVTVQYKPDARDKSGTLVTIHVLSLAMTATDDAPLVKYRPNAIAGETTTAEGIVSDVRCSDHEMELSLLVQGSTVTLHARDSSRIEVEEAVGFQTGEFDLCADLKGKSASIAFIVADHKHYTGEIQRIEVEK